MPIEKAAREYIIYAKTGFIAGLLVYFKKSCSGNMK